MNRDDIISVTPVSEGIRIKAKNGRSATLRFSDFERLKSATAAKRASFRIFKNGIRWDSIDEDVSFDSVFDPESFPLKLSGVSTMLNMSEIARRIGIQQSLMAAYVSGTKKPSRDRRKKILDAIASVGRELSFVGT